jgi:hypothetical protein
MLNILALKWPGPRAQLGRVGGGWHLLAWRGAERRQGFGEKLMSAGEASARM